MMCLPLVPPTRNQKLPPNLHPWAYKAPTLYEIQTMTSPPPLGPDFTPLTPPPGFPTASNTSSPLSPLLQLPTSGDSPLTVNISHLTDSFGSADLIDDICLQRVYLGQNVPNF
eukprot:GFUD01082647.1.p1 GENE.GFUD01082647.1~~GFUD01082647.1.p1  ORF type:complete len:113 (+),score=17.37 GFUD01082647.1:311-649(+)